MGLCVCDSTLHALALYVTVSFLTVISSCQGKTRGKPGRRKKKAAKGAQQQPATQQAGGADTSWQNRIPPTFQVRQVHRDH